MSWEKLLGEHTLCAIRTDVRHPFDADASGVALDMKTFTVMVFEDPSDGYRSSAAAPLIAECSLYEFGVSPDYIHAPVTVTACANGDGERTGICQGVQFIDRRNGKVILTLGTENTYDYYPSFVCDWRPENLADNAKDA